MEMMHRRQFQDCGTFWELLRKFWQRSSSMRWIFNGEDKKVSTASADVHKQIGLNLFVDQKEQHFPKASQGISLVSASQLKMAQYGTGAAATHCPISRRTNGPVL